MASRRRKLSKKFKNGYRYIWKLFHKVQENHYHTLIKSEKLLFFVF